MYMYYLSKKNTRRCSASLTIRETYIKTIAIYSTLTKMAIIKTNRKQPQMLVCGEDVEQPEPLCIAGGNIKWCTCRCCGKHCWFLKRLTWELLWSNNSTSGFISKRTESGDLNTYLYTMFTAVLLTIAKRWK